MAKVLFMTSVYRSDDKGNLNTDLVDEFLRNGHSVDVVTPLERKYRQGLGMREDGLLREVRFPCLNFRGRVNLVEKGLSTLLLGFQYRRVLRRTFRDTQYDLALYTTLPITYAPVLRDLKQRSGTFCYLLQKDFFPQSAVDLGLLRKGSLPYRLFRVIEKGLFRSSDAIGVMSPRNRDDILRHNPTLHASRVEICPNSIRATEEARVRELRSRRAIVRERYGIPGDRTVFLYGGNISRAQGIDFVISVVQRSQEYPNAHLLFVGSGQEAARLKAVAVKAGDNIQVLDQLPKPDFDELVAACDVGLVFLDPRFTIANIPSRTLAHLNVSQPIVAATDEFTDYREMLEESSLGLWGSSRDPDRFIRNINTLAEDAELRTTLGLNARRYLVENCDVADTYKLIMKHLNGGNQ